MDPALQQAINEFKAVVEALKNEKARNIGSIIGGIVGEASLYINKRTPEQIDAMSVPDMEAWVAQVELNPPT